MAQDVGQRDHGSLTLLFAGALIAISGRLAPCQASSVPPSAPSPTIAASPQQMPAYEVATVKPGAGDGEDSGWPLRVYIQVAFGIPPKRAGSVIGPRWIDSARYVIQTKAPDSVRVAMRTMPPAEASKVIEQMRQSLLAERFQLKAHFETREMLGYELVLAKGGSKLKEAPVSARNFSLPGASAIKGTAMQMGPLASILEQVPDIDGRPVMDKTGLTGRYDIALKWTPMKAMTLPGSGSGAVPSSDAESVSLFTAIQEQLGLKLVPAKEPVQVLVIDRIERPTEN